MNRNILHAFILVMILANLASGQAGAGTSTPDKEGKEIGGYNVQQSIELGYRFTDVVGSTQVYNTFVNQHEGVRLLEQTLTYEP